MMQYINSSVLTCLLTYLSSQRWCRLCGRPAASGVTWWIKLESDLPVLRGAGSCVVSLYDDEHMLELWPDRLRSERQSAGLLEDYRNDVVADMTLPQQLTAEIYSRQYDQWAKQSTRHFFPNGGRNHHQYSICLPTERWPDWFDLSG